MKFKFTSQVESVNDIMNVTRKVACVERFKSILIIRYKCTRKNDGTNISLTSEKKTFKTKKSSIGQC